MLSKLKTVTKDQISFIDLQAQQKKIRNEIDAAIKRVLDHGIYIMGPEIAQFEKDLSDFCGVKHSISCANGTDALGLGLMAYDVKPGDAVFVPSFTFAATAEVVSWMGATSVFIDSLPDTFNMDPASLEQGIKQAIDKGLNPRGIIPVDLFGQSADYNAINSIAQKHNLWVIADAAQSFGGRYQDKFVGNIGNIATTSFFPAKPLGCYGDGGAVFTNDDNLAQKMRSLRVHGQGKDKYDNVLVGMNGRLDTIQAAILIEKLKIFPSEIESRQKVAEKYTSELRDYVQTPFVMPQTLSAWAQYTVVLPQGTDRSQVMSSLKERGIPTFVYYIKPLHMQEAYKNCITATGGALKVCEDLASRVLSLPMHPYLATDEQDFIIQNFISVLR